MPSDRRYVLTATARRSPSARLYSAVPRSSQWPSTVIIHVGYLRMTAAFAVTVARPVSSSSALSSGKKAGLNGESRFRSSSERALMLSSAIVSGSGGTGSASVDGGGGGAGAAAAGGVNGGAGCANGGCFFPHAAAVRLSKTSTTPAVVVSLCISGFISKRDQVACIRPRSPAIEFLPLVRPRGGEVIAVPCDLRDAPAVAADGEDLHAAGARRRERDMPAVRRIRRALVGAFAERELPGRAGRQVVDLDVVARPGARRERDLVERRRRPC